MGEQKLRACAVGHCEDIERLHDEIRKIYEELRKTNEELRKNSLLMDAELRENARLRAEAGRLQLLI